MQYFKFSADNRSIIHVDNNVSARPVVAAWLGSRVEIISGKIEEFLFSLLFVWSNFKQMFRVSKML